MNNIWRKLFYNKNVPTLDVGKRIGMTEYIDFIDENELTDPIMIGIDSLDRKFICIKFACSDGRTYCQTYFQRIEDVSSIWMSGRISSIVVMNSYGGINEKQVDFLTKIINGEELKVKEISKSFRILSNLNNIENLTIKLASK